MFLIKLSGTGMPHNVQVFAMAMAANLNSAPLLNLTPQERFDSITESVSKDIQDKPDLKKDVTLIADPTTLTIHITDMVRKLILTIQYI